MKILSEKKSMCITKKIFYNRDENYYEDIKNKKKEGWRVVTKPDYYNEREEMVIKSSQNGVVLTYIKYEKLT